MEDEAAERIDSINLMMLLLFELNVWRVASGEFIVLVTIGYPPVSIVPTPPKGRR